MKANNEPNFYLPPYFETSLLPSYARIFQILLRHGRGLEILNIPTQQRSLKLWLDGIKINNSPI